MMRTKTVAWFTVMIYLSTAHSAGSRPDQSLHPVAIIQHGSSDSMERYSSHIHFESARRDAPHPQHLQLPKGQFDGVLPKERSTLEHVKCRPSQRALQEDWSNNQLNLSVSLPDAILNNSEFPPGGTWDLLTHASWNIPQPCSVLGLAHHSKRQTPLNRTNGFPLRSSISGAYTGWIGYRNMGDELVSRIFLDLLVAAVKVAAGSHTNVEVDPSFNPQGATVNNWSSPNLYSRGSRGYDFGVLGGGSTISADYLGRMKRLRSWRKPLLLFGSGRMSAAGQGGSHATLMQSLCIQNITRGLIMGGVRGPCTQEYLEQFGCINKSIPMIGDSGLLAGQLYSQGVTALRAELKGHIGKRHVLVLTPFEESTLPHFNETVHILLTAGNFVVVLQAVDQEGLNLMKAFFLQVKQTLPPTLHPLFMLHEEFEDWAAMLDLYRHASASLNSRLHSGVLSLAVGKPTVYLSADMKFEDLMKSVQLSAYLVTSTEAEDLGVLLARKVVEAVKNSQAIRSQLEAMQKEMWKAYITMMVDLFKRTHSQNPHQYRSTLCCHNIRVTRSQPMDKMSVIKIQCNDGG
ncbi:hypothetical protein CEUSTIGMA_g10795.t1 [Chlamydomonas eustigma]|uniref:Polysaccharide pyruvyl transferase domain-containing protein n=1 Tax=Chlamydomonas eustigma TaxID=1157962 RepID=A0A250XKN9_9CHLO|nr:hypothetical protein CEUSTIGMA_g10795.t1 [Chlamydomonas eustigma]|eukprot:GAX83370.1 hypothetical protein CEUSTIGMA_g10795.t1 [Chlamydomonas eustigma]